MYYNIGSQFISNNDLKYMSLAAEQASYSPMLMRHGAVAVVSGKVIGYGYNNYRTNSRDGFIKNVCACHAEVDCLRSIFNKNLKTGKRKPQRRYLQGTNQ
tara:strand:+ start:746 stop:1045 length:300 start_codon:yes stop_codon:yes gene_type:complete